MRRVERVADQQPACVLHLAALLGGGARRAGRQQQRVRRHRFFNAGPELLLPFGFLGAVFLHQVDTGNRAFEVGLEAHILLKPLGRQPERLERRCDLDKIALDGGLDVGARVVDHDLQAMRQKQRGPG